jgi:hypothetical protein
MSDEHKSGLAEGRDERRAVRRYLEADRDQRVWPTTIFQKLPSGSVK